MDASRSDKQDTAPAFPPVNPADDEQKRDDMIAWFNALHEKTGLLSDEFPCF